MRLLNIFKKQKEKDVIREDIIQAESKERENQALEYYLRNHNENLVNMFEDISKYIERKNELITKGLMIEKTLTPDESKEVVNSFFENIIDELPNGTMIPIKTTYQINNKYQILLLGKQLICVNKVLNEENGRKKSYIQKKDYFALFIDDIDINCLYQTNRNTRINFGENRELRVINLLNKSLFTSKCINSRISNIELMFDKEFSSEDAVVELDNFSDIKYLLDYLPILDNEITSGISRFLNKEMDRFNKLDNNSNESNLNEEVQSTNLNEEVYNG